LRRYSEEKLEAAYVDREVKQELAVGYYNDMDVL